MEHPAHEPRAHDPADIVALGPGARVRDVGSGETLAADAWIERRMASERRTRDECLEELMNAIGRGDVTIADPGTVA